MDCAVAREALSARIDGELEGVPSARVDEHMRSCPSCRAWYSDANQQAIQLRRLAMSGSPAGGEVDLAALHGTAVRRAGRWSRRYGLRLALALVGLTQIGLAVAQSAGADLGIAGLHLGVSTGTHIVHESTAWTGALGVATVAAAFRPTIALGLAFVLATYAAILTYYELTDAIGGEVTAARIASHVPVAVAAILALLVARADRDDGPPPQRLSADDRPATTTGLRLASLDDRLRPKDDSAA